MGSAVAVQNPSQLREAKPVRSRHKVGMQQTPATITRSGSNLDPLFERKRTHFVWGHRIRVSCDSPVRGNEFNGAYQTWSPLRTLRPPILNSNHDIRDRPVYCPWQQ